MERVEHGACMFIFGGVISYILKYFLLINILKLKNIKFLI